MPVMQSPRVCFHPSACLPFPMPSATSPANFFTAAQHQERCLIPTVFVEAYRLIADDSMAEMFIFHSGLFQLAKTKKVANT